MSQVIRARTVSRQLSDSEIEKKKPPRSPQPIIGHHSDAADLLEMHGIKLVYQCVKEQRKR